MLKSDENRIIINDFIQGEPLSEENLDKTLDIVTEFNKRHRMAQDMVSNGDNDHNMLNENVNKIRLLTPERTIWLYTGYRIKFNEYFKDKQPFSFSPKLSEGYGLLNDFIRSEIVKSVNVLVDVRYIDSQRDISLKWCGSSNQRLINIQKSISENKIVLHCN